MAEWFKGVVIDSETLTPEIGENWRLNASCYCCCLAVLLHLVELNKNDAPEKLFFPYRCFLSGRVDV